MSPPFDYRIMGNARDHSLCPTQLDFDLSRFPEQLFETFFQRGCPRVPEQNLTIFFPRTGRHVVHDISLSTKIPFSKRSTARSLPHQPPILLLIFFHPQEPAQTLTCTRWCAGRTIGLDLIGPSS
jgi:hypothetical protein